MTGLKRLLLPGTRKILLIVPIVAVMAAQAPPADQNAKQKEKNLVAGEREAKQMLLLMDRDLSGKVSKQEFMSFMEAEFQRLDVNKDGELDVKELTQFRLVPRGGVHR